MWNKSLFGGAAHFANIGSWKAGSPTSNPLLLKAQSRQLFVGLQQSHSTTLKAQSLHCSKSWRPQLRDQTLCFSAWDWLFLQLQRRDGHDATIMRSWACCSSQEEPPGNGFLKRTCGTNLFSAVRHILRTSAAERPAAPLPTHCC